MKACAFWNTIRGNRSFIQFLQDREHINVILIWFLYKKKVTNQVLAHLYHFFILLS